MTARRDVLRRWKRVGAGLSVGAVALTMVMGCAEDGARDAANSDLQASQADPTTAAVREAFQRRSGDSRFDPTLGSLVFPAGTTYGQALLELTLIQSGVRQATEARIGPPLPGRAALALPGPGQQDVRVSLAAPEGYDVASGRPLVVPLSVPAPSSGGRTPVSPGGPWPAGAALPVPVLPECMVSRGADAPAVRCGAQDVVQIRRDSEVPLP